MLLADYVAGLGLSAALGHPGRLRLPLAREQSIRLLEALQDRGKLVTVDEDFTHWHEDIYGDIIDKAREFSDS